MHTHFSAKIKKIPKNIYPLTYIHWERSFGDANSEKKIKKYARHQNGQE